MGFEPTVPKFDTQVFKTSALSHSAIPPGCEHSSMGVTHGQCLMSPAIMLLSPLNKSHNMGLFELVITIYIGVMIYFANLADLYYTPVLAVNTSYLNLPHYGILVRRMLFGIVAMAVLFGIYAARVLMLDLPAEQMKELGINPSAVSPGSVIFIALLTIVIGIVSLSLSLWPRIRQGVHVLFGSHTRYNPESQVHLAAMVLALCLVGYLFTNFVIGGGLSGVAQSIEENGISLGTLVFQGIMFVVIACLGVGLAIRRTLSSFRKTRATRTHTAKCSRGSGSWHRIDCRVNNNDADLDKNRHARTIRTTERCSGPNRQSIRHGSGSFHIGSHIRFQRRNTFSWSTTACFWHTAHHCAFCTFS